MKDKIVLTINVNDGLNNISELMGCIDTERDKVIDLIKKRIMSIEDLEKEGPRDTVLFVLQQLSDMGILNFIHLNYIFGNTLDMAKRAIDELIKEGKLIEKEGKLMKNNENN